jgi:hypothetical protein
MEVVNIGLAMGLSHNLERGEERQLYKEPLP